MNAMMTLEAPAKTAVRATAVDTRAVLVVGNGESSRALLESMGCETTVVSSGAEAVEAFERLAPDLCLVDLKLADMRGLDLLRVFRVMNASVPCVVVSATRSIRDIFEARDAGAADYLVTPLDPKRAALTLDHAIRMARR